MYFARIGIALSVLFNVILGGYSNQTFSARNYAWKRKGVMNLAYVIDTVFYFYTTGLNLLLKPLKIRLDPNHHSMQSWVYWVTRRSVYDDYLDEICKCKILTDETNDDNIKKVNQNNGVKLNGKDQRWKEQGLRIFWKGK